MKKTKKMLEEELEQTKLKALKAFDRLHPFVMADMPGEITSWFRQLKAEKK